MIHVVIPSLPPSSNHAYATIRGTNKRVLTQEGRSYKTLTTAHLARSYPTEMTFFKPDVPYLLVVKFTFKQLYNSGWPKKADSRFKRIDVGNRLKLLEDSLKDAGGFDDSQNMTLILQKVEGQEEKTEIWAWNLEQEESPFSKFLNDLSHARYL